ncbi:MAG: PAS domain-containing sensor histidine kinase [Pseudomonadales bacterium]
MITYRAEILDEIERRRLGLTVGLLKVYNYYRVLVGLALIAVSAQTLIESRLGDLDSRAFLVVASLYTLINLLGAAAVQIIPQRIFKSDFPALALVVYDILFLSTLTFFSGGVSSGLGVLVLVAVAIGSILVSGRLTNALPAFATIAVLYEEFYLSLSAPQLHDYFQAGILGVLYFAAALSIRNISQRIRLNDIHALTQAAELADLERVNRLIIQRMRTGIVLVDQGNQIRMANQSARALLGQILESSPAELPEELPEELERHLMAWRKDTYLRIAPFHIREDTPEIRVAFSAVRGEDPLGEVTIFIEDTGEIQQQAQQLKLADLGRLSASIAHEIRNPLGAISHAAQLLSESQNLDHGDSRLTDIIHNHCKRMNNVIENVLEMSRRNPPVPVKLCLNDFLEEFKTDFLETSKDAVIEIDVMPRDTEVRVDRSQLTQTITNLVENGIRYSLEADREPFVRLEGGLDARTDRPYLNVIDHGPGVHPDQLANLFEPFFTTGSSGTGLGLYISRELCEANQARLNYHPQQGDGSCFRITFAHPDRITA